MKVNVTEGSVVITECSYINEGEVGVNECSFVFPACFDGLSVTAAFNNIPVPVFNNKCNVPSLKKGTAVLGVYAYKENDEGIELMYSPKPTSFFVNQGSYSEEVNVEKKPTISEFEQYCKSFSQQILKEIRTLGGNLEKTDNKVTVIDRNVTDKQYPSAKAVYDFVGGESLGFSAVENPNVWELEDGCYYASGIVAVDSDAMFYVHDKTLLYVSKDAEDETKKYFVLFLSCAQDIPYEIITGATDGTNAEWAGFETEKNRVTEINKNSTDLQYPSAKAVYDLFSNIELPENDIPENAENKDNKVTVIDENSTDEQYPSAKSVYDELCDLREYIDLLDTSEILDSGKCGENLTWTLRSSGLLRISGTGPAYDYCKGILIGKSREEIEAQVEAGSIPADYAFQDGKTYDDEHGQYVAPWYKYRSEVDFTGYTSEASYIKENPNGWKYNRILIDSGITYIGDWMFYRASGPTKLVVPEGVTKIGRWGIRYSPTLKNIVLPNSLTEIEYRGVSRNEIVTNITFGKKMSTIGDYGLTQNHLIEKVELPDSVTSIGATMFESNDSLVVARLGHVTSVPSRTFVGVTTLKDVVIPEEVTSIGEYAFYKCASLEKINIPSNVATIDSNAFYLCDSLHDVYIDSQVVADLITSINSCGYLISNARRVYLKEGITSSYFENGWEYVETVDGYKRYNSYAHIEDDDVVKSGYIGATVYYILRKTEVDGEYKLTIGGNGALTQTTYTATPWYEYKDNIVSVSVGSGVLNIPQNCFNAYPNLKTAVVSCETIPNNMFYNCTSLESVTLDGVTTIGNNAFANAVLEEIIIPDGVTTIGNGAFNGVKNASSVTIGKDVTSIIANAFASHTGNVIIPADNSLTNIGSSAFVLSQGTGTLNLPVIVTIGDKAFKAGKSYTNINIGSSIETIGTQAFENNINATITIDKSEADITIGENAFKNTPADKLIFVPDSTGGDSGGSGDSDETETPEDTSNVVATGSCGSDVTYTVLKTDVDNEYSLSIDGSGALGSYQYTTVPWIEYKENIVSVSVGSGVSGFPVNTFREYTNLKSAVVSCETIPNQMFYKCSALTTVDLTGVKTIGDYAFFTTALTDVVIPDGVTTVGKYAFASTKSTSVTIGKDVTDIGQDAFNSCTPLLYIPIDNAIQNIGKNAFGAIIGQEGDLDLPSVVTIGDSAFKQVNNFTNINIGSNITSIGASAFTANQNATITINKAEADITIGDGAFTMTPADKLIFVS